jgi:hypothetical protein
VQSVFDDIKRILKEEFFMKKALLCLSVILLSVLISFSARADIFYTQDPFTSQGGLLSSVDPFDEGPRVYDDFTLGSSWNITGITWLGYYSPAYSGPFQFEVSLHSDNEAFPTLPGESYSFVVQPTDYTLENNDVISAYSITLETPFAVTANERYWLSIYATSVGDSLWAWQIADPLFDQRNGEDFGSIQIPKYVDNPSNVAFQLIGSPVPIPSAAWLLGSGLIGLALIRRRIRIR